MSNTSPSPRTSPLRRALPTLGSLLAFAACCAAPLILPALLGAGATAGLGAWLLSRGELLGLVVLLVGLGLTLAWRRARARADMCSTDGSCGCGPGRHSTEPS